MKKLIDGILEFRTKLHPKYRETFARLALGQAPDALFISCSDSRVAVNVFASTDPGDLFVVRNVGNMIPPCGVDGASTADESEAAAIEFALLNLNVNDMIICGHSECGAMQALINGRSKVTAPNLNAWLRHGEASLAKLPTFQSQSGSKLTPHNALSQLNILQQLENLRSYPIVRERINQGRLRLHGWWFDLHEADVYAYDAEANQFSVFNEDLAKKELARR